MTGRLRHLDDRVMPALSRGLRAPGRLARAGVGATGTPGRTAAGVVRRFPVAIAAVGLIVLATALIVVTGGDHRGAVRPKASTVVPALTGQRLGPVTGTSVAAYTSTARLRLQQISSLPGNQRVTAVVDLTGYLSPRAFGSSLVVPGVSIIHAFARVPTSRQAAIHTLNPKSAAGLAPALAAARSAAETVLTRYQAEVTTEARKPSAQLEAAISAGTAAASAARLDARGLGPTCRCVFALLVSGPATQLLRLASHPDVRVMDPAPPGTPLRELMVVPLEPQVSGTVPPLQFAGE
jgi:hypothetical protein